MKLPGTFLRSVIFLMYVLRTQKVIKNKTFREWLFQKYPFRDFELAMEIQGYCQACILLVCILRQLSFPFNPFAVLLIQRQRPLVINQPAVPNHPPLMQHRTIVALLFCFILKYNLLISILKS